MVNHLKRLSLYIFYGLLAYMPLHIFISTWVGSSLGILSAAKIAKDVVLVFGFSAALIAGIRSLWFKELLRDRLVWLVSAYTALHFILALLKPTDLDAEILGIVYNLRFLLFFAWAVLLVRLFPKVDLSHKAIKIVVSVSVLVVAFGIFQYLLLPDDALRVFGYSREKGVLPVFFIDNKPDLERVMSTVRDPNSLGSYLIIIGALWLVRIRDLPDKGAILAVAATTLCLWFTFSRSAWIGFILMLLALIAADKNIQALLLRNKRYIALAAAAIIIIVGSTLALSWNSYFVQNVILHADESTRLEDPNELRVRFVKESAVDIANEPAGAGPGTAGLASIRNEKQGVELNENYYLQIAREVGLIGLLLFMAILGVVALRLWSMNSNPYVAALFASFVGLAFTNLLVHIWANEAVAYTWWGLAGLMISMASRRQSKKLL